MGGPPPNRTRRRANVPVSGEWRPAPGHGWQHGDVPTAQIEGSRALSPAALEVWDTWMASWAASNWTRSDVPGLRLAIALLDRTLRYIEDEMTWKQNDDGTWTAARKQNPWPDLFRALDSYGITPKGQQDRRWVAPEEPVEAPHTRRAATPYARLRAAS